MNVCGELAESGEPSGDSGSEAGSGADGGGPDGCSFACPTRAHWITGTFTITYANPALAGTGLDGRFLPLVNESISFVLSFDEGAITKQPNNHGEYDLEIILSQGDLAYQGDTSGVLDKYVKPSIEMAMGNALFAYAANEKMTVGIGSGASVAFSCSNLTLQVAPDQYIVPGDVSCSAGSLQISEDQQTGANFANGMGTFVYH
jgi:hypothetical protein